MPSIEWHYHHYLPKHEGGTDDRSNLIRVNKKMHIFLHWQLAVANPNWNDIGACRLMMRSPKRVSEGMLPKPHVKSHTEFKPFICDYCAFEVRNEADNIWHKCQ